jgi:hypothetical protein
MNIVAFEQMKLIYMSFDFLLSIYVFKHILTNVEEFSTFLPSFKNQPNSLYIYIYIYIYFPNFKKLARLSSFFFFFNKPIFKVLVLINVKIVDSHNSTIKVHFFFLLNQLNIFLYYISKRFQQNIY